MKGSRAALVAVVAVVLLAGGWWLFSRGTSAQVIDLIQQFDTAVKRPAPDVFQVIDAELNGETRRAIYAPPPTRITWKVQVPDDAWLRVSVGTRPDSWTQEGDGTYFFVGVSDGRAFEILFSQHVNAFGNTGDRKWIPVWVDLSTYAGEEVELIFNTRNSAPDSGNDTRNDHPLWGAPEIIVR